MSYFDLFMAAALFALFVIQIYIIKKIKRIDDNVWNLKEFIKTVTLNEFKQLSSLDSIYRTLNLTQPLSLTRGWAGSPDFLLQIVKSATECKPQTILECSCGTSTVVLAAWCRLNGFGHVYSLESDSVFAGITKNELKKQNLSEYATVIYAPLKESIINGDKYNWYVLDELPDLKYDMLVIDGPPANEFDQARYPAIPLLKNRLNSGANIFLDDSDRSGEKAIVAKWMAEMPLWQVQSLEAEKGLVKITVN